MNNISIEKRSFPMYDTPTGYILGADLLGKPHMGECIFPEGTTNVPPKVAALYYAADRHYNIEKINIPEISIENQQHIVNTKLY